MSKENTGSISPLSISKEVNFTTTPKDCLPYTHVPVLLRDEKGKVVEPIQITGYVDNYESGGESYTCFGAPAYANLTIKGVGVNIAAEFFCALVQRDHDTRLFWVVGHNLANASYFMKEPSRQELLNKQAEWCKEHGVLMREDRMKEIFEKQFMPKLMNDGKRFMVIEQTTLSLLDAAELSVMGTDAIQKLCEAKVAEAVDKFTARFECSMDAVPKEEQEEKQ